MEINEKELARMSVEELKEICKKLQTDLSTVEWYLRQKQMLKITNLISQSQKN